MKHPGSPSQPGMIVRTIPVANRTYEQRFNLCHRKNCHTCYGRQPDYAGPPGHGPYWYLCVTIRHRWTRIYIGKELDTTKYVLPDGSIDWATLAQRKKDRLKRTRGAARRRPEPTTNPDPDTLTV